MSAALVMSNFVTRDYIPPWDPICPWDAQARILLFLGHESSRCLAYSTFSHSSCQLSQYVCAHVKVFIIMAPKCKSSDSGSLDVPWEVRNALEVKRWKFSINRERKISYAELQRFMLGTNLLYVKLCKRRRI